MKKTLAATALSLVALSVASAAHAADVSAPATYDWTGFYLGANAGFAWNNSTIENNVYHGEDRDPDFANKIDGGQTAFTAGGLLGYNYQIDQIVLGAEADINYLGFSEDNKRSFSFNDNPATSSSSFEADWFGTIRGRLGYAFDNVLIYGTGGAAYGHVSADGKVAVTIGDTTDSWKGSANSTNWGWTVGGGAEYAMDNWSIGAEYLYVDLGDGNWKDNIESMALKGNADYAFSTVRATVKYHFN